MMTALVNAQEITSATLYLQLNGERMTVELPKSGFTPLHLYSSKCIIDSVKVTTTGDITGVRIGGNVINSVVGSFGATLEKQSDGVWTAVYNDQNQSFNLHLQMGWRNEVSFAFVANPNSVRYNNDNKDYYIYITPPTNSVVNIDGIYYSYDIDTRQAKVTNKYGGPLPDCGFERSYRGNVVIPSEITINNNVYSVSCIGDMAFILCGGVSSVSIPNSVKTIGFMAFDQCDGLKSINLPNSVTSIGGSAFWHCVGLTSITIPENVTTINDDTFYECRNLKTVILPRGLKNIGSSAFGYCNNIDTIVCEAPIPPACINSAFNKVNKGSCKLYVYNSSIDLYKNADEWKTFGKIESIENNLMSIPATKLERYNATDIYMLNGRRLNSPQKGLNIIKMKDGTFRKVITK